MSATSACEPEAVEAYAAGELGEAEAARVAAHVASCRGCAEELRWLRAERRLFRARAAAHPGPPPLEAVLARAAEEAPACAAKRAPARAATAAQAGAARGSREPAVGPAGRASAPWGLRAAAGAALLAIAAAVIGGREGEPPPVEAVTDLQPARDDEDARAVRERVEREIEEATANTPLCDESACDTCVPAMSLKEDAPRAEGEARDHAASDGAADGDSNGER
ncbi:zf-HC2 domain-containing protein [Sorangium sp. So ce131]|uniref:zf-HC2 domain-containing protein n=1 Tax=Sorangium sp. So ce131 TaxID=3133282 RepID=UPI003F60CE48